MKVKLLKTAISILCSFVLMSAGCKHKTNASEGTAENKIDDNQALPYFGESDVELIRNSDGTQVADTVYYTIPKFSLVNQENQEVSFHNYENKIFIADFFFTECPSICPAKSAQMSRLQSLVKAEGASSDVMFISFSVKPEYDTPSVLKAYGDLLGADYTNWNFLTGDPTDIYELAEDGFMLSAFPSDSAQGGIFHTDKITLVDRQMHIRGYYDGTSTKNVDQLFSDIKKLLREQPAHVKTQS